MLVQVLLALVLVYVVLGIIGAIVHGLIWLTILAAIFLLVTMFFGGARVGSSRAKRR